jgi:hypothetical protein
VANARFFYLPNQNTLNTVLVLSAVCITFIKILYMKKVFFTLISGMLTMFAQAQVSPIMVCNPGGTTCSPYTNIDSAYTYANAGDYIYLPGGVFTLNSTISKEVHLIGSGFMADSSVQTGITTINGNINLIGAASNSSIEGMYISGSIITTAGPIDSLQVSHCNVFKITGLMRHAKIRWCIVRTGVANDNNFENGINNTIQNCYIQSFFNLHSSMVDQCSAIRHCENLHFTTIKNSTFQTMAQSSTNLPGSNNIIKNNVFVTTCPIYCVNTIQYTNNVQSTIANLLNAGSWTFGDMRLKSTSAGMTHSETGGQVGVYGGLFPYKAGAVPSNPHIFFKTISASTNANGELPVQINARAEDY